MTAQQTVHAVSEILEGRKAVNLEVLDLAGKTILADFFIVATGTSTTHVRALADAVKEGMEEKHQRQPHHVEGYSAARWILLDYGEVVVHLMQDKDRQFYDLEKFWQGQQATPS